MRRHFHCATGELKQSSILRPSHERDWADDVAQLLQAEIDGNRLTLRNVRNFDWHSEDDYTVRWETREYDLWTAQSFIDTHRPLCA